MLTANHDAFVWWNLGQEEVDAAARAAGEETPGFDPATQGVSFPLQVRSLKLPDLPNEEEQPDRIIKLACGDEFVVALSEAGKVFYLDIACPTEDADRAFETLENDCLTGRRQWTHLERFSHAGSEAAAGAPTKMTHVSAHFNTFAACEEALSGPVGRNDLTDTEFAQTLSLRLPPITVPSSSSARRAVPSRRSSPSCRISA